MQEHKSFLIRDLLGDVLSERVHGKSVLFISIRLDAAVLAPAKFVRDSFDRDTIQSNLFVYARRRFPTRTNESDATSRTRVDGEMEIFIGRGSCRVAGN